MFTLYCNEVSVGKGGLRNTVAEQSALPQNKRKVFSKRICPIEDKMVHKRGLAILDDGAMDSLETPEVEVIIDLSLDFFSVKT